jgi:hypothetical protein
MSFLKNRLRSLFFPLENLRSLRSGWFSARQRLRMGDFRRFAPSGSLTAVGWLHTSGQPVAHAAAIIGLSRKPRRIRL